MEKRMRTDILIAGTGCSALYCALNLPGDRHITMITKKGLEDSDSYLAQGGMCMLKSEEDYDSYFEDTLKAGHYENDRESVDIMIRSSQKVVDDLLKLGVDFARDENGELAFTKEGAHSEKRIVFHEDVTGREITSHLLLAVQKLPNVTILENTTLLDIIDDGERCVGGVIRMADGSVEKVEADYTVLATGGIGGLYRHSTNFRHLTGDALGMAIKHGVELKDVNYVQIHPTTFYSEREEDRSFLISESVRGEGARLYDKNMNPFVNELLPRDILTQEIKKQMEKDGTSFVWEDLRPIPEEELRTHFPNIVEHCRQMGYDVTRECIPVTPAQHYFMGGIKVNHESRTSMRGLYAIGETACNGVHGRNRLASNSLLESLVFAARAAKDMSGEGVCDAAGSVVRARRQRAIDNCNPAVYADMASVLGGYRQLVLDAIRMADEKQEEKNYA
jgi:L-aspartate oxidase